MDSATQQQSPKEVFAFADDEIHVWRSKLDCDPSELRHYGAFLSPDEKERAARFHFEGDRNRFIVCRGALRSLLGLYIGQSPSTVEFRYGPQGKPSLRNNALELTFNLTHSHGLAVYAFSRKRELGIDAEAIRPDLAGDDIAERFFSEGERKQLQLLSPESRLKAFFLCWTRKEAYVKARGEGLHISLSSFGVSLESGLSVSFLRGVPPEWHLFDISEYAGVPAALVCGGKSVPSGISFRVLESPGRYCIQVEQKTL